MSRHAWWRGERADVTTIGTLTGDVAGSVAPPILTWQRRTERDRWDQCDVMG